MKNIEISVVIPAYNEEKYIKKTINKVSNVLNQLNITHEIIVVDNLSTDNTSLVAKQNGAKIVKQNIRNIGMTRNAGAEISKYPYLMFIDSDSLVTEKLIKKSINKISQDKIAISAITKFDTYPNIGSYGVWLYNILSKLFKLGVAQYILISKIKFNELRGFDESLYAYEELDFFKRLKSKFGRNKFIVLSEPIITSSRKFKDMTFKMSSLFALQLFLAILNPNIGRDKNKLGFWYGEQRLKTKKNKATSKIKKILGISIILMLFFDVLFLINDASIREYSHFTTPFLFILMGMYLINNKSNLKYLILIALITILIEAFGLATGIPFGNYSYNSEYAIIGILGVPIYIGLAWYLIITSVSAITKNPLITAIGVVIVDIIIERFAYLNNLWSWSGHSSILLDAPYINYLAWFIIGFVLYFIAVKQVLSTKDAIFILTSIMLYMVCIIIVLNF